MGCNKHHKRVAGSADRGNRCPACQEHHHQRDHTERAIAAVLHDFELALARVAAAETVGDIGDAVLVQAAGYEDRRGQRHDCRKRRRQAEPITDRKGDAGEDTDDGAGNGGRPERFGEIGLAEAEPCGRQPSEEAEASGDVGAYSIGCQLLFL